MGLSKNSTKQKNLIFLKWLMEQNFFYFWPYNWNPWWTGPAPPDLAWSGPTRTHHNAFWRVISQSVQWYKLETLTQLSNLFQKCRVNFWTKTLVWFRNYNVFRKAGFLLFFHTFLRIFQEPIKESLNIYQNKYGFYLKNRFLVKSTSFHLNFFFWKSGQGGGVTMADSSSSSSSNNSPLSNKTICSMVYES